MKAKTKQLIKCGITAVVVLSFTFGCAISPDKIPATYVSPQQYESYSCNQLGEELIRVNQKVIEVSGQQRRQSIKDASTVAVALIVFLPALFLMNGPDYKDELGRLKGEYEAIEQSAVKKGCSIEEQLQEVKRQWEADEEMWREEMMEAERKELKEKHNFLEEGY